MESIMICACWHFAPGAKPAIVGTEYLSEKACSDGRHRCWDEQYTVAELFPLYMSASFYPTGRAILEWQGGNTAKRKFCSDGFNSCRRQQPWEHSIMLATDAA